jgi:hypothetical protein
MAQHKKIVINKTKKNNNLVLVTIDEDKKYFTSYCAAAKYTNLNGASILYAIKTNAVLYTNDDKLATIQIVDGTDVKYDDINN